MLLPGRRQKNGLLTRSFCGSLIRIDLISEIPRTLSDSELGHERNAFRRRPLRPHRPNFPEASSGADSAGRGVRCRGAGPPKPEFVSPRRAPRRFLSLMVIEPGRSPPDFNLIGKRAPNFALFGEP